MSVDTYKSLAPPSVAGRRNIVDALIEERAVNLREMPRVWPLVRKFVYPVLGYRRAVRMADTLRPMRGRLAINWMSAFLDLNMKVAGAENVPTEGPIMFVANHPGGIADGVALWDAVVERRRDLCFFANRDAVRVCPGLVDQIIPVEWRPGERTPARNRETIRAAAEAMKAGRAVVIFPAGRIAQWKWEHWRLTETPWATTPVGLARKYDAPIIPIGIRSRMSMVYYACSQISKELRDMTLFHELLNARGSKYRVRIGAPIDPHTLAKDPDEATEQVKQITVALTERRPSA